MLYRLLGELEIGQDGHLLTLPRGPTLTIFATLAVNANRAVSKADLIRAAWDSEDVGEAQLHKRVKMARDLLAEIGRQGDIRTHARFGYELRVADEDADWLLFQRLVRAADESEARRRPQDAVDDLRRALQLWRGPHPLANVPGNAFHRHIAALEQRHRSAAVRLFDLELDFGNHERILDELLLIAGYYPADLRLCEQLMTAELRCRHMADAGKAYERYQAAGAEETGNEPDALLRTFHFAIARNDTQAIAIAEAELARRAGRKMSLPEAGPRQLPTATDLVGRDHIVAELTWLLRRQPATAVPIVVISGPGGIGKTALALRAAHESTDRYPDGQLYMELRGTVGGPADTSEVLAQFLRALGAVRVPDSKSERQATYRTLLASRRVLIVLDDAADGEQVGDLIPGNPACAVLVTARRRLPELSGAHHLAPLEPLGAAHATKLFLRVVSDAGIHIGQEDEHAVSRLVALCGGLPLALRIAAALRVNDHPRPTSELADRLARQGPDGFSYGRMSVARAIGAGFDQLDQAGRQLFLGLGWLMLNSFSLWTAAALLDAPAIDAAAALSQLAASSMIQPVESGAHYGFHELTKDYARRRAMAEYPGDRDAMLARVYRALLTLVRRAHAGLYGGDFQVVHGDVPDWNGPAEVLAEVDASPREWFEKERTNIRAAIEHCAILGLAEMCWDLAVSTNEFYATEGYFDDWHATHTLALNACRQAGDRRGEAVVLTFLNQPALVASQRGGGTGTGDLQQAIELLADSGDRHGQAIALTTLANALRRQGHLGKPLAMFTEAVRIYDVIGDTVGRWQAMRFAGQTYLDQGNYADARRILEASETVAGELGGEVQRLIAQTRYWLGQTYLGMGDAEAAQAAFEVVSSTFKSGIGYAYAMHGLGDVARVRGSFEEAERYLATALGLARERADAALECRTWLSIAALHQARGRRDEQAEALTQAAEVAAACGAVYLETRSLAELADTMTGNGESSTADTIWTRIRSRYDSAGIPDQDRLHVPGH